ncbi:MAG: ABC transporter permease [Clostridiales bacterium]|nr:ABC transporter permease [Clostridiales bacterium]
MKIRTWKRMVNHGFRNMFRNRIMSLASISAITAALFILGLVLVVVMNFNNVAAGLESKTEVTVFLKSSVRTSDIKKIEQQLDHREGIKEWEFISRMEALENWRDEWGDKKHLLDGYNEENNPLPDSFHVTLEKPEYVAEVVEEFNKISAVENVQYSKDAVDSIAAIVSTVRIFGVVIVAVLVVMAMIIIHNTIRISVYSRRREVNIMKYIGATDWYIRWPFLMEGLVLGLLGAVLSGGLVAGVYSLLLNQMTTTPQQYNLLSLFQLMPLASIIYPIAAMFLLVGSVVGISASLLSIRKHLRV